MDQEAPKNPDGSLNDEALEDVSGGMAHTMSLHQYHHAADQLGTNGQVPGTPGYTVQSTQQKSGGDTFWNG